MTTFVRDLFNGNGGVSSLTGSFDGTGCDYLRIYVYAEGGVTVSSVAFAAQTPTLITSSGIDNVKGVYQQIAPTSGSQTYTVTFSGSSGRCAAYLVGRSGVHQSTPSGTPATAQGDSASATVDVTSASGQLVEGFIMCAEASITNGAGQTERENQANWASTFRSFSASEEAGATTVTISATPAGSTDWWVVGVPILPAAAAGNVNLLTGKFGGLFAGKL